MATVLAVVGVWFPLLAAAPAQAATGDPSGVSFGLQGCRLPSGETLPNGNGDFICNDADYSPGNQGKNWAELDLVPFRLTATAGNSAPSTQTYTIGITADSMDSGHPGYDIISVPVLNTSLSDNSCTALSATGGSVGTTITPGIGGTDQSLGRTLTITQLQNTTCVYDYYERLALGSHLFPGSSLHSNLTDQNFSTSGSGAKDVPIPVKEIQPQELSKESSATQGSGNVWDVTKTYGQNTGITNTCLVDHRSTSVTLDITWTKTTQPDGNILVTSNVTATNPASRTITVGVTDTLYAGNTASGTQLTSLGGDTNPSAAKTFDVAANSQHVFVFQVQIAANTSLPISDKATATYTDKATGITVPGTTTATAIVSTVQTLSASTGNNAVIKDVESLDDFTNYTLAATQDSGATGSFQNGYTAGDASSSAITWQSDTVTAGGSASFTKTVAATGPITGTVKLQDTAQVLDADTLQDEGGPVELASTSQHTDITVGATTTLTVNKSIPFGYGAFGSNDGSVTFDFTATDTQTQAVAGTGQITFDSGANSGTSHSTTISLPPGTYSVTETQVSPYDAQSAKSADTTLPDGCTDSVSFVNDFPRATAEVQKATDPAGNEAGWTFTLTGPGVPEGGIQATTTGAGFITFDQNGTPFNLIEGNYTVTEAANGPYDNTAIFASRNGDQIGDNQVATGKCQFTVDYPGDASAVYGCSFTNTKHAEIIVNKTTVPSTDTTTSFPFVESGPNQFSNNFSLNNGGSNATGFTLQPGSGYSVAEGTLPAGWSLTAASCSRSGAAGTFAPTSFSLAAGDVVTCNFTNTHRVALTITKAINANGDSVPAAGFVFSVSCSDGTTGTVTFHDAGSQSVGGIVEGSTCDVTETPVAGWTSSPSGTQHVTVGATGATVAFTNTRDTGVITVTKSTVGAVAGASTVFTFDVVCPNSAFNQTLTIDTATQTSATSTAIPTGMVCTVTERSTAGWQQTTPAQGGVDVTVPGTATFENTRLTGPLQLSKSVTPTTGSYSVGDPHNTLTYTLSLSPTGSLDHTNVVVTDYIPGYDPSYPKSGKTTYVANSATCSTGCSVTYDATHHQLTWAVGNVNHGDAAVIMKFKVTIDQPAFDTSVGLPIETIDNIGFVKSTQQAKTPSNLVKTPVEAVLGIKVVRPPAVLPFTGMPIPATLVTWAGMLMVGVGVALTTIRRRRRS